MRCWSVVLLFTMGGAGVSWAQNYPVRPISIVVPSVAGGPTDIVGRMVGQILTEQLGQSAVIDNRAGAGNTAGIEYAAKTKPDGYTLAIASPSSHSIAPSMYPNLGYDPARDFTGVSLVGTAPLILVAHPSLPINSVKDLVALAKGKPGELNFGTGGSGTTGHLTAEYFKSATGINTVHIPFRGVAPATIQLLGGHTQYMFHISNLGIGYVQSKKLKGLAITSKTRSPHVPEVPTMVEAGVPGFVVYTWYGVAGPRGLDKAVVDRLQTAITTGAKTPEMRKKFESQGLDVVAGSGEELMALIREEIARWAKVVKASGAKVD
jgi:tripartite-type tricarboxylate transporter receptor subunit TctC